MNIRDILNIGEVELEDRLKTYVVQADHEGRIYDCSEDPVLAEMLGLRLTEEQIRQRIPLEQFLESFSIPLLIDAYRKMQEGQIRNFELDGDIIEKGHTVMHPHVNLQRTRDDHYVVVVRDETKLTHTNRQRKEALDLYGSALALIAHDLRNPLSTISSVAALIEKLRDEWGVNDSRFEDMATILKSSSEKMLRMVDEHLLLARVEGGKYVPTMEPVLLHRDIVKPTLESCVVEYSNLNYDLGQNQDSLPVCESDVQVLCDVGALRSSYENIMSNAIKYGGRGTKIRWGVYEEDGNLAIYVRNTQSSLTEEEIHGLFQRFHRVERLAANANGLGLGLYLCKRLLAESGGDITASSDGIDYTEFKITVPYRTEIA